MPSVLIVDNELARRQNYIEKFSSSVCSWEVFVAHDSVSKRVARWILSSRSNGTLPESICALILDIHFGDDDPWGGFEIYKAVLDDDRKRGSVLFKNIIVSSRYNGGTTTEDKSEVLIKARGFGIMADDVYRMTFAGDALHVVRRAEELCC